MDAIEKMQKDNFNWLKDCKEAYIRRKSTAYSFASEIMHITDSHRPLSNLLIKNGYNQPTLEEKLKAFYLDE